MKKNPEKLFVFFFTVLLFLCPAIPGFGSNGEENIYLYNNETHISLSFENYKMKDGWTPIVLSMGELNCQLWMDKDGNVSELQNTRAHVDDPVCVIDVAAHCLRKAGKTLYFDVYEQDNIRSRWKISSDSTAGKMPKKISLREDGADICLGDLRLSLFHVTWDAKEFSPGLLRVQVHGPLMSDPQGLIYEKDQGIFYSTFEWEKKLLNEQSRQSQTSVMKPAATVLSTIPPQERAALIALYNKTNGDRWGRKNGWKTPPLAGDGFALPGTENTWYGITCDPGNTTVQSINLRGNGLSSTIPAELANLTNLQVLKLQENSLQGNIPPELGNLNNLQSLDLNRNMLSGTLPSSLGNLANLQSLDLNRNSLSGPLPSSLGNLANLQSLYLQWNFFNGSLPSSFGNLSKLQILQVQNCSIHGSIPPELGNLAELQLLYLNNNFISGTIPSTLGNLVKLQDLRLSENLLTGSIPSTLGNLANLKYLHLNSNMLINNIPQELGNLTDLLSLQLYTNQLSGNIPPELGNLANLQVLALLGNLLNGNIPPELGNLANLQVLALSKNLLNGNIPPELGNLVNLNSLSLGDNQLSGLIPPELGNLVNLTGLSVANNKLTGIIPPGLVNLVKLNNISFANNQLTGNIPPIFENIPGLRNVDFSQNQLSGNIPFSGIENQVDLRDLDLSFNQLSGNIPPGLGQRNLGNFKFLVLCSNQLSGSIPPDLGNLSQLRTLDLSFNHLSGTIPPELGNLFNLGFLKLDSNQLSGSIPQELGNLWFLCILTLNSNRLSGSIPPSLMNLGLCGLDLRWNSLYTDNDILRNFLNEFQFENDWESTQTIAPLNVFATVKSTSSIAINWTPITYTSDTGGYRVFYSTTSGGPYTYFGMTANKSISSLTVTGLTPAATYYFVVKTRTNPNDSNENIVDSEYSSEATVFLPPLMLTSPNGGESWVFRTVQRITWKSQGLKGKISLELWKGNEKFSVIANKFPIAKGSYAWLPGNGCSGVMLPGNDYKIKIITENGLYYDFSDGSFSIVREPTFLKKGGAKNF